jgi:hypothetical protein
VRGQGRQYTFQALGERNGGPPRHGDAAAGLLHLGQRNEEHLPELRKPHSRAATERVIRNERTPAPSVARLAIIAGPPDLFGAIDDEIVAAACNLDVLVGDPRDEVPARKVGLAEGEALRVDDLAE